jgi:hypothetical protein
MIPLYWWVGDLAKMCEIIDYVTNHLLLAFLSAHP